MHLAITTQLMNAAGFVPTPGSNPINFPWFNTIANIPANMRSIFPAPNPVVVAGNIPRPVSGIQRTYGYLPPVSQAPLGSNTRI